MELRRLRVKIQLSVHVKEVKKQGQKFLLYTENEVIKGDVVILATGGCASPNLGSDGSGYQLAKSFGHRIIKPLPALVQVVSKEKFLKTIQGVRCQGSIQLFSNGKVIGHETGELLFTNYGISGIPILQISRFVAKELDKGNKVTLGVDFMPELRREEVKELLMARILHNPMKNLEEMMIGLLNHKLSFVLLKESGLNVEMLCKDVGNKEIDRLVNRIKGLTLSIIDTNPFDQAQVSSGGVSTKEIDRVTLESKLVKGLFFTGEVMDVDGTCGGYNLQWAWSSGVAAARGIEGRISRD